MRQRTGRGLTLPGLPLPVILVGAMATALLLMATLLAGSNPGSASARSFETGFSEPLYQFGTAAQRQAVFQETVDARSGIVRVNVVWRAVTNGTPANPSSPTDPAYNFAPADAAVTGAVAKGLDVMITVYGAPAFAEGGGRPAGAATGSWKPDPEALRQFATALAGRYSGAVSGLPRVRYFQAWNEPNLSNYVSPQYENGQPFAVGRYRSMLNAFYAGVKSVDSKNQVVAAGTAPYGDPPGGDRTHPRAFLRDLLCLTPDLTATACPQKANFDIFAHHPINTSGGPTLSAVHPDDASTPDFKQVVKLVRAAERVGTTGTGGSHPAWATEIWWESDPPDGAEGVSLQRQARYLVEALYLLWRQHAEVVINLRLRDGETSAGEALDANASGVLFADGSPKPAFTAFRFPFVADRMGRKVLFWGKAPRSGKLAVQRKLNGRWATVKRLRVSEGKVFKTVKRVDGAKFRARLKGEKSLTFNAS